MRTRKRGTSDVDVNIRVAREDGKPLSYSEVLAVLRALRANLARGITYPIPLGYKLAAINWKRPSAGTGWRSHGDPVENLEAFYAPMYVKHDDDAAWSDPAPVVRLGSIKR